MANQYEKYKRNQIKLQDGGSVTSNPNKLVRGNPSGLVDPNWMGTGTADVNKVLRGDNTWGSIEAGINYVDNSNGESGTTGWTTYNDRGSAILVSATAVSANEITTTAPHGLVVNDVIYFDAIAGSLTGLTANTRYYVASSSTTSKIGFKATRTGAILSISGTPGGSENVFKISVIDGTGGIPGIAFDNAETVAPIRGTRSFRFIKGASVQAGEGVATPMRIADADLGKILNITFEHKLKTGTISPNDVEIWLYDLINARLVQPVGFEMEGSVTSSVGNFKATFQTDVSTSTTAPTPNYRLIIHNTNPTLTSYNLLLDTLKVTPEPIGFITPVTDWTPYTINWYGTSSDPTKGTVVKDLAWWRRVGDSVEVRWEYYQSAGSGNGGVGYYQFNLPNGIQIDPNKTITDDDSVSKSAASEHGWGQYSRASTIYNVLARAAQTLGSENFNRFELVDNATWSPLNATTYNIDTALNISVWLRFPVLGWGSNVQSSSIDDGRVVTAAYTLSTSVALSTEYVKFNVKQVDSHAAYNTSTGEYIIPSSGKYYITVQATQFTGTTDIKIKKNGVDLSHLANSTGSVTTVTSHVITDCVVGDIITAFQTGTVTLYGADYAQGSNFCIFKLASNQTLAREEKIIASGTKSANQAFSGSQTVITYPVIRKDTHGALNGSTGRFTVPVAGDYRVSGVAYSDVTGTAYELHKNGTIYSYVFQAVSGGNVAPFSIVVIDLVAGDYLELKGNAGGAGQFVGDASKSHNNITIESL